MKKRRNVLNDFEKQMLAGIRSAIDFAIYRTASNRYAPPLQDFTINFCAATGEAKIKMGDQAFIIADTQSFKPREFYNG